MWKKLLFRTRPESEEELSAMSKTKSSRTSFLIRDLLAAKPAPEECSEDRSQEETRGEAPQVVSSEAFNQHTIMPSWFTSPLGLLFGLPPHYIGTGTSWPSHVTTYSGICTSAEGTAEKPLAENISRQNSVDQLESLDLSDSNRLSPSLLKKNRRNRTVFTEVQLMGLERRFDMQKYLSTPDRAELARALGLTQLQVKTWYQNRRMKWKKQVMQGGCPIPPTRPKGRPKKNSIPSRSDLDLPPMIIHDLSHIAATFTRSGEVCDT